MQNNNYAAAPSSRINNNNNNMFNAVHVRLHPATPPTFGTCRSREGFRSTPLVFLARRPGRQRHARGTLWQYQERQQSHTTPDWARVAIMATELSSPVNERFAPAGPTHTACSHKLMMSWAARRRCSFSW
eukprot:scaffold44573_cov80-Phaeocystis_antarctica.AAC.1